MEELGITIEDVQETCGAGKEPNNVTMACDACEIGFYKSSPKNISCTACPTYSTTSSTGSVLIEDCLCATGYFLDPSETTTCLTCNAGLYTNGSACLKCGDNSFSPPSSGDRTDCTCNKGYHGPDGGTCTACGVGTYKSVDGSTACSVCEQGTYMDETGGSACKACPANTDSPIALASFRNSITTCICNAGYDAASAGVECTACVAGKFKEVTGSLGICEECSVGAYSNLTAATECFGCPANTNSPANSDDITDCVCNMGFEGPDGMACTGCEVGYYKRVVGSSACLSCQAGSDRKSVV